MPTPDAGVAELVDAGDSKSPVLRDIRVQFPSPAIFLISLLNDEVSYPVNIKLDNPYFYHY